MTSQLRLASVSAPCNIGELALDPSTPRPLDPSTPRPLDPN
ncbi:MAG: hypothetical protein GY849_18715 [Deltaproteobacteria bacterium]|nr:hypothetical protein [Deltaproteobacteria bacterium]